MNGDTSNGKPGQASAKDRREERLAAELRANLARRKAQARARRDGAADERPEGIAAAGDADGQRLDTTAQGDRDE